MSDETPGQWLPTHSGGIYDLHAWRDASGGTYLASSGSDTSIQIWDAGDFQPVGSLSGHLGAIFELKCWDYQGVTYMASASSDSTVCIWIPLEGTLIRRVRGTEGASLLSVAPFVTDDRVIMATGSYDGKVSIWNALTGELLVGPIRAHTSAVVELVFCESAPGETVLISAGDDGAIRMWDPSDGSLAFEESQAHDASVETLHALSVAGGHPLLISGSEDGLIHFWEVDGGLHRLSTTHASNRGVRVIAPLSTESAQNLLASGSGDGSIKVWTVGSGDLTFELPAASDVAICGLAAWESGRGSCMLASGTVDGVITVWDVQSRERVRELHTDHVAAVWALGYWESQAAGGRLASAGADGVIRIWNPESGVLVGQGSRPHGPGVWTLTSWQEPVDRRFIASGSLDGSIQIWNADTMHSIGEPFQAHAAAVSALVTWRDSNGNVTLASAGDDAAIYLWDPFTGTSKGGPFTGHAGGLLSLVHWETNDGGVRMASAGADGIIRVWNPNDGSLVRELVVGEAIGVFRLEAWSAGNSRARLIAGYFDGHIRVWDPDSGSCLLEIAHDSDLSTGRSLTHWFDGENRVLVACNGETDIRIWSLAEEALVGDPLCGHVARVRTMTCWRTSSGEMRLASAGDDGTIRLWDPENGRALRTVEIGPVTIWGLSDSPAERDLLHREDLVEVVVDQLTRLTGPAVVTVEGPWGCGKSTLMAMINRRLRTSRGHQIVHSVRSSNRLTVRKAMRLLQQEQPSATDSSAPPDSTNGAITAWFDPWAHQSGEQIWAGLVAAIVKAVEPVLYPTRRSRQDYWFSHNIGRVDRHALRQMLRRRIVSPILGVALVAVAFPAAINLLQINGSRGIFGYPATVVAALMPCAFLIAGIVHTIIRYFSGQAANYLPYELFVGPMGGAGFPKNSLTLPDQAQAPDPLLNAPQGSLYLYQHDIQALLSDLKDAGFDLIVFVDDLDRCRAATTSEVFEAINLFLSGLTSADLQVRFVIGIDPSVVAAHLNHVYHDLHVTEIGLHGEDPSIGWAFLRKLVQLPVLVPQVSENGLENFVNTVTGSTESQSPLPFRSVSRTSPPPPGPEQSAHRQASRESEGGRRAGAEGRADPLPIEMLYWRVAEQHPAIQSLLKERLMAQPDRSLREAKRLINVWQLYLHLMQSTDPLGDPAAEVERAQKLIFVAEIITRWPALHRAIFRWYGSHRGLQLLAAVADDDQGWEEALSQLEPSHSGVGGDLEGLRQMLRHNDGPRIAELALRLV